MYAIILLSLNQALVFSASLSAHPVGSDDLSDRTRHRRAYRRPWWSCAALHSQSALNFLAGHQIHLKRKASYDKRGKEEKSGKKEKVDIHATGGSRLIPESRSFSQVQSCDSPCGDFGRLGHVVQGTTRTFSIVEAPAVEVCVIILYGQFTLAVEPELLKPGPHI